MQDAYQLEVIIFAREGERDAVYHSQEPAVVLLDIMRQWQINWQSIDSGYEADRLTHSLSEAGMLDRV